MSYKIRSVLLDTGLLVLLIVGFYDRNLISIHKRTNMFVPEDYDLLVEAINGYEKLWVTSHCLAEVSNLIRQTNKEQAKSLMLFLARFISTAKESHIRKDFIFNDCISSRLGITDTGLIIKAKRVSCVFTVDKGLYDEILKRGYKAVNFNHLRLGKSIHLK